MNLGCWASTRPEAKGLGGFEEKLSRQGFAITLREKRPDFLASGCDSASVLVASAHSRTLLAALLGVPGRLWTNFGVVRALPERARGTPGARRGHSGSSLGAPGWPERVPGSILDRFWEPWGPSKYSDCASIFGSPRRLRHIALVASHRIALTARSERNVDRKARPSRPDK